jgi:arylsulfatase
MAISAGRDQDKGGIRHQFHHIIDIVPTILEATHIRQPAVVDGIRQSPIEGTSMVYTFDKKNAGAPSTHHTQYFEMMGDRAIYHDGWIASTKVMRPPWDTLGPAKNPETFPWELYDLRSDWTQSEDLAKENPKKLRELQALFVTEARKYQVFPLDTTVATRLIVPRPSITAGRSVFTWTSPLTGTPNGDAPSILNTSYNFKADIEVPQGGAEGMLITQGGRFAGYGFYLLKGKPVFNWNLVGLKWVRWEGAEALAPGRHSLEFDFKYDGLGIATLAFNNLSGIGRALETGVLKVDGKVGRAEDGAYAAADPGNGRNLTSAPTPARRPRLPGVVHVHWQDQQDHAHDRPAEADAGGRKEADGGAAQQQGERVRV